MIRLDKRRSIAERLILGFLVLHYGSFGSTYEEIAQGTKQHFLASSGREGLSTRQVKRHISAFLANEWVSQRLVAGTGRFSITRPGYFYYHRDLEHRDVSSLELVPGELLPPLMAKGVLRLTIDQARYFREYLGQDGSLLVMLPAGAGKALIARVEAYQNYRNNTGGDSKVLYVSPYKAINSQSTTEFRRVLGPFGMVVAKQDGDNHTPHDELLKANLVVSTFESTQLTLFRGEEWIRKVGLVIVDELTFLDAERGREQGGLKLPRAANLDLLITSLLHTFRASGMKVKFVCLGIPNASQPALQRWLGDRTTILSPSERFERCEEKIAVFEKRDSGEEWHVERKDGVRLEGPYQTSSLSDMERMLTVVINFLRKLFESSKDQRIKPILVFVRSRKDASESAIRLQKLIEKDPVLANAMRKGRLGNSHRISQSVVLPTSTIKQLRNVVNTGIGFHHAGLFHDQRRMVEHMMNDGSLSVLFATTTLTHGVDFPVGVVIIDAQQLDMLGYSRLEYLQLRGRVDHKDPFHETRDTADALVVMSQGNVAAHYNRVRALFQGVDPPLDPQSLQASNAKMFLFRAIQYLTSLTEPSPPEQLAAFANSTFYVQRSLQEANANGADVLRQVNNQCASAVDWCKRQGLIRLTGRGLEVRTLGKIADEAGLAFYDAVTIARRIGQLLRLSSDPLVLRLLSLAISLIESSDEVREAVPRVRLYEKVPPKLLKETERLGVEDLGLRYSLLVATVYKWIGERPVSEIVVVRPEFQIYESGLLTSTKAIARNLFTIAEAIDMLGTEMLQAETRGYPALAETARLLAFRVRYGVADDIASSELGRVAARISLDDLINSHGYPELLMRIALRLMTKKGWSSAQKLREYNGKKPITAADLREYALDREAADHLKTHPDQLEEIALRIVRLAKSEGSK